MSFPIDGTIPAAGNDPADDQPIMKQNFENIKGYLNVDHVLAGTVGAGKHKQITYNSKNVPAAPLDPVSISYTNSGVADPTHPQNFWKNSQGIFPLSAVRAILKYTLVYTAGVPAVTINANFNVSTVTAVGAVSTITLVANSTFGADPVILITTQGSATSFGYTFVPGVITVTTSVTPTSSTLRFHVIVLQV